MSLKQSTRTQTEEMEKMETEKVELLLDETEKKAIDAYLAARGFETDTEWEQKLKVLLFLIDASEKYA